MCYPDFEYFGIARIARTMGLRGEALFARLIIIVIKIIIFIIIKIIIVVVCI